MLPRRENPWEERFLLVIIDIRRGLLDDAHDRFEQENKRLAKVENWKRATWHIRSEIEFEIAFAEERWGEAILVCESLIESYRSGGYRWLLARRLIDLGDALVGRNEPSDLERARETYQQSLDMFTEMGAPGYIKVLEERLGDL